jgi:hypothetical protein
MVFLYKAFYERNETLEFQSSAFVYVHRIAQRFGKYLPDAYAVLYCGGNEFFKRCFAYATGGSVDYAFEGLVVVRVHCQTEVCYGILDFLALIKGQTAINAVWNISAPQGFLQHAALSVGAV